MLEQYNLFSTQLGVTDLICQGLQVVMRDIHNLKDPSVDAITIALFHLSVYLANEIAKGFCNFGTYRLRPELHSLLCEAEEMQFVKNTFLPNHHRRLVQGEPLTAACGRHVDKASREAHVCRG